MGGFVLGGCEIGQELREDLEVALFVPGTGFVPPGCLCFNGLSGYNLPCVSAQRAALSSGRKLFWASMQNKKINKQEFVIKKNITKIKQKQIITYKPRPKKPTCVIVL